ncbi:MAG: T9SS type A sorting domain-containing protein [Bacteroidetes bacterium]|nr:T9SS type A sorting domain-containing protein [Bacteroidota bacterium]
MGGSWEQHSNGLYRKDIFRLKVNENDDIITGSEYEGIFRSLNRGESFEHVGLPISRVNNIVFYEDNLIIAATPSGVQKYNRLTYKWENIGLHNVNAVDVDKTGSIYAGTDGEGLFYLRETGGEWINISQTPYILNVKKLNETILAATTDYLIRSTDEGNTWENTPVNSGVDNNAIEINNNGDVWAVGFQKLFKSTDDGLTFSSISLNFRYVDRNNLYVNDSLVFLGDLLLGKGIHYSTDYASTWQNKYHHRGTFSVSGNNNYVIYGTPEDIFFTIDKGLTWDSIPYPNNFYGIVIEIEFDKNGQLFFGTSSQGLFEMDFVVSIEDDPPINKDFYLSQNYPNPFNPTTNISYSISQRSFVTLKIYDVLGNEITTLINKEMQSGSYEVEFDASNLPSGIYFYQIRAGAFVDTKKLVLMK